MKSISEQGYALHLKVRWHKRLIMASSILSAIILILSYSMIDSLYAAEKQACRHKAEPDNPVYNTVLNRLSITQPVTKQFTQHKYISALGRTLISSGLLYISQKGICWKTIRPFKNAMLITSDSVTIKKANNSTEVKKVSDDLKTEYIVKVMRAMFMANKTELENEFHVCFEGNKDEWQISLIPKNQFMSKAVRRFVISGSKQVSKVIIYQTGKDHIAMDISDFPALEFTLQQCFD